MINFINFLSTPSHNHHKHVNRWHKISCTSILMLLASLAAISTKQLRTWHSLEKTYKQQMPLQKKAQDLIEKHGQLSKEKAALLEKTEEWEKYTHHAKKPSDLLTAIKKSTKHNKICCLRTVRRSVHMQVQVSSAQDGMIITQNLWQTTIFDEVKMCSFKPCENNKTEVTIEGCLKKA